MGIKKIVFKGTCRDCGKVLPIPQWTVCDDCNEKSFRNTQLRKQIRLQQATLRAERHQREMQEKKRAINWKARILLYDEVSGVCVGWKD